VNEKGEIDWFNTNFVSALISPASAPIKLEVVVEANYDQPTLGSEADQGTEHENENDEEEEDHVYYQHQYQHAGDTDNDGYDWEVDEDFEYESMPTDTTMAEHSPHPNNSSFMDIQSLVEMGFQEQETMFALNLCCNDVQAALEVLTSWFSTTNAIHANECGTTDAAKEYQQHESSVIRIDPLSPLSIAEKLRLDKLKSQFTWVSENAVRDTFDACNSVLTATEVELIKVFPPPKSFSLPTTTTAPRPRLRTLNSTFANKLPSSAMIRQHKPVHWVETGNALKELYEALRGQAIEHAQKRNAYFREAVVAYRANDKKLAKELGAKGREHNERMHKLHTQASEATLQARNPQLQSGSGEASESRHQTLDLHGLHVTEAIQLVEEILHLPRDQSIVLFLIVGTGHHTFDGRARVRPSVLDLFKTHNIVWVEPQPGLLAIQLDTNR
jgi:DNA-nicking Smr family endonuclease